MSRLKDKGGAFNARTARARANTSSQAARTLLPETDSVVPPPPARPKRPALKEPDPAPVLQEPAAVAEEPVTEEQPTEPAVSSAAAPAQQAETQPATQANSAQIASEGTAAPEKAAKTTVEAPDNSPEPVVEDVSEPEKARAASSATTHAPSAKTVADAAAPIEDLELAVALEPIVEDAGFCGEIVDGFPVATAGPNGMLQNSGEELRNTSMRVSPELRRNLHALVLWEGERTGERVELERIIDAALVRFPVDLDDIEKFLDTVPLEVRQAPPKPTNVGTRMRKSQFDRIGVLPNRMGAEGRRNLKLAEVHRAVLWSYYDTYRKKFQPGAE